MQVLQRMRATKSLMKQVLSTIFIFAIVLQFVYIYTHIACNYYHISRCVILMEIEIILKSIVDYCIIKWNNSILNFRSRRASVNKHKLIVYWACKVYLNSARMSSKNRQISITIREWQSSCRKKRNCWILNKTHSFLQSLWQNMLLEFWECVIWGDDSKFNIWGSDGKLTIVWRGEPQYRNESTIYHESCWWECDDVSLYECTINLQCMSIQRYKRKN